MLGLIKDRYLFFRELEALLANIDDIKEAYELMKPIILMKDINAIKDNKWTMRELKDHIADRVKFWQEQCNFSKELSKIK